ncbi:MAG TPA: hypothetical protein PK413_19765, partial [Thermoanaerobaculia bacterium]|nr:hypothetical protein [Thermoanaerobaculia bacterium]
LVLVLVEEPRTFELLGLGGVQDTFRIRGISAGHGLRHLQLIFVLESQHGTPLIEAVKRIDLSLGPLNPFIRYFPAGPGFVEGLLEWAGDSPTTPTGSGIVAALVGLGQRVLGEGGSIPWGAIPVLILGLVLLNLVASWVVGRVLEVPLHLLKGWVGQPLAGLASLAADLVGDLVPVIGGFAILVYGSLSQVIAIAQQSGGEVAPLIRLTRSANSADLEVPALLAMLLAIAYVLAQGFRVAQHLDLAEVRIASLRGLLTILTAVVLVAAAWMLAVVIFSLEGSLGTLVRGVFSVQALAIIALALLWPTAHTDAAPPPPPPPLPLPQRKPRP